MNTREIFEKIPILRQLHEQRSILQKEEHLAQSLFDQWIVEDTIQYNQVRRLLKQASQEQGINADRTFYRISELYNPSRSI